MVELEVPAGTGARAAIRFTERDDGDFAVAPSRWIWLRQVHGARAVVVTEHGGVAGETADAAITGLANTPLAIRTADCAPVALVGDGVVAAVHVGWAGLLEGVLEAAVEQMATPPAELRAVIGPCIRPADYEFGAADLDRVAARLDDSVRSVTREGAPALDLAAGVRSALGRAGAGEVEDLGLDTADGRRWFSHRLRGEAQRNAMLVTLASRRPRSSAWPPRPAQRDATVLTLATP